LKIVVHSLKSVKHLPGVQNDSNVMNTPRFIDSPVVNTLGSLDFPVMNTPGSRLVSVFRTSIRLPSVLITRESGLPDVFCTSSF
jgi:hypothetical protein